jgi:hypothetical protein
MPFIFGGLLDIINDLAGMMAGREAIYVSKTCPPHPLLSSVLLMPAFENVPKWTK